MKPSIHIRYYKKKVKRDLKRFQNVFPLSKDSYPFIALETSLLRPISDFRDLLFLDLGCGPGPILQYAKSCGHKPYGVEINPAYKNALSSYDHIIADINDLNPIFYSQFDFIYSYLPLKRELFKVFLESKLIPSMAENSILYTPHFSIENERLTQISQFLYRVGHKIQH